MKLYSQPVVEWLGTTPNGWSQPRLKSVFHDNTGAISMERLAELEVHHYSIPNFDEFGAPASEDGATIASNKTLLRGGEVLYSKLNCHKPRVWLVPHDNEVKVASTEFIPLVEWHPGSVNKRFITYLIGSAIFAEYMTCFQTSVTNSHRRINPNDLWQTRIPLPPLPEQQRIAEYLDASCAAIDAAVAAKRRQLETLDALRKGTIKRAVTMGLNPVVKTKRTDVECIPQMPEHWRLVRVKDVMEFFNTVRVPLSAAERGLMADKVYDYYGASGVIDKVESYLFDGTYILLAEDGANLLTRSKPLAFLATGKFWVNNHAHILKPRWGGDDTFFVNLLESQDFSLFVTGAAQPKLTMDNLGRFKLAVPRVPEQKEIASFIHQKNAEFRPLFGQIETQIAMLTAYRKSLIHECVTGQRRIRG
jgi:type I restriction enzyme S subunit